MTALPKFDLPGPRGVGTLALAGAFLACCACQSPAPKAAQRPLPPPTPSSAASCEGALLCDGFEDDALGQVPGAPWSDASSDGAEVAVSDAHAHSGAQSVQVRLATGKAYRRGYFALHKGSSPIFPATAQEMFGRAWFRVEQGPEADVHWTFIQGEGAVEDGSYNRLYRFGGQHQQGLGLMANYETTKLSTDCWQHSSQRLPIQRWVCVEWHFATAGNTLELWLDGEPLTDLRVSGQGEGCLGHDLEDQWLAPPQFESLYLGWERYQEPNTDRSVWVDDVAVGTQRVGCGP